MTWQGRDLSTPTGRPAGHDPRVRTVGARSDIAAVSAQLSDDRTQCTVPHHPSLSDYCQWECRGRTWCEACGVRVPSWGHHCPAEVHPARHVQAAEAEADDAEPERERW